MNILHVVPSLDLHHGGPSRSIVGMAKAQKHLGADTRIVTGHCGSVTGIETMDVEVAAGNLLSCRYSIPTPDLARRIRAMVSAADIVHLHSIWNGTVSFAGWRCRSIDKPMLLSPRGMLDAYNLRHRQKLKKLWFNIVEKRNLDYLTGFHFLDESEREGCSWLGRRLDRPCLIQPNGTDLPALTGKRIPGLDEPTGCRNGPETINLVYLGRLHPIKGLDLQIRLLAALRTAGKNAHLHLIGPDDGIGISLKSQARDLGVAPSLHLHGPIYDDQRLYWLKRADAVLLTSHYECNSNTAVETMMAGGVLVATDTCHLNAPSRLGAAKVVPRELNSLLEATLGLISNSAASQRQRSTARDYAIRHLAWSTLGGEMLAFYQLLIQQHHDSN